MGFLKKYCLQNFNAIIISKIFVVSLSCYPSFKKLLIYFFIYSKQYKKSLLLFYIVISILFGSLKIVKKNLGLLYLINLVLKKKRIMFLLVFINFYLPILGLVDNKIKQGIANRTKKTLQYYRVNYFSFPVIPELDLIYEEYESIYNIVSNYRLQMDFVIKTKKNIYDSSLFLLRMYRYPCILKIKGN